VTLFKLSSILLIINQFLVGILTLNFCPHYGNK
jgi:hypothetical protein